MMPKTTRTSYQGVIDADGHINEPPDLWEKYIDPQYRDRAIRIRQDPDGRERLEIAGRPSRYFGAEILSRGRSMGLTFAERAARAQQHYRIEHVGRDKFFWATDYPHDDHTQGYIQALEQLVAPLSERARRGILGENVSRVYGLHG